MEEDKWQKDEQERVSLQPETQQQLVLLTDALQTGTADATMRLLLLTRTFSLQVVGMVETLQQRWGMQEPLEVVAELVRQALDRVERESSLLVLLEELEVSEVAADPVAYLTELVQQDRRHMGQLEVLVKYEAVPYSHLVGIQTPAAMRERWRRAIWTIMQHNRACARSEDRWYINMWAVAALAGGTSRALATYLEERQSELTRHHQLYEVHPNVNRKSVTPLDMLSIAEDPPPEGGEELWVYLDEL